MSPRPQWVIDSGFANRLEAAAADCFETNAYQFSGGRRLAAWQQRVRAWSPRDLSSVDVRPAFAVEGLIQERKVGALVAAGGTGKTTVLLTLGICHALGRQFFGHRAKPGTLVLLSNDDPQQDLEAALELVMRAMKLSSAEREIVRAKVRVVSLLDEDGNDVTKAFTTAVDGVAVPTDLDAMILEAVAGIDDLVGIALDTLRQFSGGSSNDEQVIKLTIASATRVAQRSGAYVVLPHHTGKQNYRDGITDMYAGSGSAAIADNCRFVLLMQTTTWADIESKVQRTGQEHGDPFVITSTRGSLLVRPPQPIFLHRDGYYIGRVAGAIMTKDQQADEKDRKILRAVATGKQTKSDVYSVVKGKKTLVFESIDDLVARGHLTDSGSRSGSRLMLTASGTRLMGDLP